MNAPPTIIPKKIEGQVGTMAVDPDAIRPCLFKYVYIWTRRKSPYWAWLTYVGRRSVAGYRWNGKRWIYFGTDLKRIDSFICM
jgi:hypothetical protein